MARTITRRQALAGVALACATGGRAFAQDAEDPDLWPELARVFFNGEPIVEDPGLVSFEAPARAEDAALVPMSFSAKLPAGDSRRVVKLTLVIDQNPVPLAAEFALGEKAGDTRISTRVRVNSYTNVHLVAELSDGSLHMATRFVKAAGGCSAPMVKSMDEALASLGQMKFRLLPPTREAPNEALLMIRHPNISGLQMDQLTRLYTPARYVDKLAVYEGTDLIFSMKGGISISEDPNFRFTFKPSGAKQFRAEGEDTKGTKFSGVWPATRDGA
jgi:sulfur-oxidizing protein SoxY